MLPYFKAMKLIYIVHSSSLSLIKSAKEKNHNFFFWGWAYRHTCISPSRKEGTNEQSQQAPKPLFLVVQSSVLLSESLLGLQRRFRPGSELCVREHCEGWGAGSLSWRGA